MPTETTLSTVGHAIQLSLAPVFLLTAIASFLGVLANRLARVIDRARAAEARVIATPDGDHADVHAMLATLSRRARLISHAITLCTVTALFICGVIVALFIGAFFDIGVGAGVAVMFVAATLSLIVALLCFLREIFIATAALRIGIVATDQRVASATTARSAVPDEKSV
jgi:hypothetical protein